MRIATHSSLCNEYQPKQGKGKIMSRKDYRIIAEALKESKAPLDVVNAMARALKADNPNFDYGKFWNACDWL